MLKFYNNENYLIFKYQAELAIGNYIKYTLLAK